MAEDILQVERLAKSYAVRRGVFKRHTDDIRAIDDVSFSLQASKTLGLVGESGSGKSTLARVLLGLETPTAGLVRYRGTALSAMTTRELNQMRRHMQIVFQDPYASLNPRMQVRDLIAEPWRVHPDVVEKPARNRRLRELLDTVGLAQTLGERYPHQLSGGQRQRVGVARALALEPEVLILDEPVSALDVSVQAQIINLLIDLQDAHGYAYLFIAHDLSVVRHISDELAVMYLGRFVEQGPAAAVYRAPSHPYTQALLSAAPPDDLTWRPTDRIRLAGEIPDAANPPEGCRFRSRCWRAESICREHDPELAALADEAEGHEAACHYAGPRAALGWPINLGRFRDDQ